MFMTPIQTLYDRAARNQDDTAFIAADDKWTYKRFAAEVHRVAHGLAARGIRKGDRIALHLPNCPELAVALYACFHIGAIAVPVNNRFKGPELKAMFRRLQPVLYVGHADLYGQVRSLSSSIVPPERCFITGSRGDDGLAQRWTDLQKDLSWDVPSPNSSSILSPPWQQPPSTPNMPGLTALKLQSLPVPWCTPLDFSPSSAASITVIR
jgi:acyl-CoA synthetase (AMP-forming)/AMP-acid ligase II